MKAHRPQKRSSNLAELAPPLLRSLPRHHFDSAKDGELQGSDVANVLKASGKFHTVTTALPLPHGALLSIAVGGLSTVKVEMAADIFVLRCGVGGRFRAESDSYGAAQGRCIIVPSGSPFMALGHDESSVLLSLHHQALARALGTNHVPHVGLRSLDKINGEILRANVFAAAQAVEQLPDDMRAPFLRNFQNAMACAVAALLRKIHPEIRTPDPMIGRRKLADLREWAALDHPEPLTIGDLAARCGLGLRALQKNFLRNFDTTPLAFLRELRLEKARRLLQDEEAPCSVTAAALEAGFAHLGRFAAHYHRKFGEAPSATAKRLNRNHAET